MKTQTKVSKTGTATYCAKCGCRPAPSQRRRSKYGRKLMICRTCSDAEK